MVAVLGVGTIIHARQTPGGSAQQDQAAALKQSIQAGLAKARQYEWIETTIVSLKGEEKSRKQQRCYYGVDGKVQKIPLESARSSAPSQSGGRGRGGKLKQQIVENKKEEMADYMERAAALVHSYVPPFADQIQNAKDAGRIAVTPQAGGPVNLEISQYLKAGDSMTVGFDPATSRLLTLGVKSYLDSPDDAVTLDVQMNTLPDGALYAAQSTLNVKAKQITVVIQNTGHRAASR
jgi:hypothetical protein